MSTRTYASALLCMSLALQLVCAVNITLPASTTLRRNEPIARLPLTDSDGGTFPDGARVVFRAASVVSSSCGDTGNHVPNTHFRYSASLRSWLFADRDATANVHGVSLVGTFKLCYSTDGTTYVSPGANDPSIIVSAPIITSVSFAGRSFGLGSDLLQGPLLTVAVGSVTSISITFSPVRDLTGATSTVTPQTAVACDLIYFVKAKDGCAGAVLQSSTFNVGWRSITFASSDTGELAVCFRPSNIAIGGTGNCASTQAGVPLDVSKGSFVRVTEALLGAPTGLAAGTPTPTTIPLTWTAMPTASGFRIQYQTGDSIQRTEVFQGATSATLKNLMPSTTYTISIQALNSAGWGTQSGTVSATTAVAVPKLVSVTGDDPDDGDGVFGAGDTLTFVFSAATNYTQGTTASVAAIKTWINFPNGQFFKDESTYTAQWTSATTLVLTVTSVTSTSIAPSVGSLFSVVAGAITNPQSVSVMTNSVSMVGNWGTPGCVVPASIVSTTLKFSVPVTITPSNVENARIEYKLANSSLGTLEYIQDAQSFPSSAFNISSPTNNVNISTIMNTVSVDLNAAAVANNALVFLSVNRYDRASRTGAYTRTFSSIVSLSVPEQNSAPVVSVSGAIVTLQQVTASAAQDINDLNISDVNFAAAPSVDFTVLLSVAGAARIQPSASVAGVSYSTVNLTQRLALVGTMDKVNSALASLQLVLNTDARVGDSVRLIYAVSDGANGGSPVRTTGAFIDFPIGCSASTLAPALTRATWTSGLRVQIGFNAPIFPKGITYEQALQRNCSYWFTDVSKLGTDAKCVLASSSINVLLGTSATLAAGDSVTLAADRISACAQATTATPSSSVTMPALGLSEAPVVNVFGASTVDTCTDATISWSIRGLAGRDGTLSITGTGNMLTGITIVDSTRKITIPNANLQTGANTLTIEVTNWAGQTTSASYVITKAATNTPNLFIVGDAARRVNPRIITVVSVSAASSTCGSNDTISYVWSVSPTVAFTGAGTPRVVFATGVFTPGQTYTVTCTAGYGSSTTKSTVSAVLQAEDLGVTAVITGGSRVQHSTSNRFVLDARRSSIGSTVVTTSDANFTWSCRRLDNDDQTCYNNSNAGNVAVFGNAPTLVFSGSDFNLGEVEFTLVVTTATTTSTAVQTVVFVDGSRPEVRIVGPSFIGPADTLALNFYLISDGVTAVCCLDWRLWEFQWSVEDNALALTSTQAARFDLVLNAGLRNVFVPGRTYTFRLTARNLATGLTGFAQFSLEIRTQPTGGTITATPDGTGTGTALSTGYTLNTQFWAADLRGDEFLSYTFFYVDKSGSQVALAEATKSNSVSVKFLPQGDSSNRLRVGVIARVRGSLDDSIMRLQGIAFVTITINPPASLGTNFNSLVTNLQTEFSRTQDGVQAAQGIAAMSDSLAQSGGASRSQRQALVAQLRTVSVGTSEDVTVGILKNILTARDNTSRSDSSTTVADARAVLQQFASSESAKSKINANVFFDCFPSLISYFVDLARGAGANDFTELFIQGPRVRAVNRRLLALTSSQVDDAEATVELARQQLRTLSRDVITSVGETYSYTSSGNGVRYYLERQMADSVPGFSFGPANVSLSSAQLLTPALGTAVSTTPVDLHLLYYGANPYNSDLVVSGAAQSNVVLRTSLVDVRIATTQGIYIPYFNSEATKQMRIVFATPSGLSCALPDCVMACARYDASLNTWTTSNVSTGVISSGAISCETQQGAMVGAFTYNGPGAPDTEEDFVGSWQFYAVIGTCLLVVAMIVMCCCLFHRPHLDPTLKKMASKSNLSRIPGVGRASFHDMSAEEKKQNIIEHPSGSQHKDMHQYEHHEVQHLARQWTVFFQSNNDLSGAQNQDQFIAVQLAAGQQAETPGNPDRVTPGRD